MNLRQRASGVLLHVTSLPGPHGVGDFGPGAFRFVDWLGLAGQKLWQILPLTPVGPGDSPYQSPSAFAGSALMVALEPLVERGWLDTPKPPEGGFDPHRVDFAKVIPWRLAKLRKAAAAFFARAQDVDRKAFEAWCRSQAHWLEDYALFMALDSAAGHHPWWEWEGALARREPSALEQARTKHAEEIAFWRFVQWCFDEQCTKLRDYANERGIAIMGDVPIFIAHHSADCWSRPDLYELDEYFHPTAIAGVPPDAMAPTGQRWGNPLYRWERMAADGYAWWIARVRRALAHADIFRIDHFRGFAQYWEIPASCATAIDGAWVPGPGKALFDAIERELGRLPIVAEDLGFITPDVIELRRACDFPGMKILQFAFGGDGTHEFLPHNYEPHAFVYTGTHDNDTARGWWDSAPPAERAFAAAYLGCSADDVHWAMIRAASNSVANFAVFPMQDVLGLGSADRFNTPGTLGGSNWTWRLDASMLAEAPARKLATFAAVSGRSPGARS
jgi:4-alpha-glucanotransferase